MYHSFSHSFICSLKEEKFTSAHDFSGISPWLPGSRAEMAQWMNVVELFTFHFMAARKQGGKQEAENKSTPF